MTPYGALGMVAARPLPGRLVITLSADLAIGSTHRVGQIPAVSQGVYENPDGDGLVYLTYELAPRFASTARLARRGA